VTHTYDRQSKKSRIHSLSVRNIVLWAAETAPSGRILTKTLPDGPSSDFTNLFFPLIPDMIAQRWRDEEARHKIQMWACILFLSIFEDVMQSV